MQTDNCWHRDGTIWGQTGHHHHEWVLEVIATSRSCVIGTTSPRARSEPPISSLSRTPKGKFKSFLWFEAVSCHYRIRYHTISSSVFLFPKTKRDADLYRDSTILTDVCNQIESAYEITYPDILIRASSLSGGVLTLASRALDHTGSHPSIARRVRRSLDLSSMVPSPVQHRRSERAESDLGHTRYPSFRVLTDVLAP